MKIAIFSGGAGTRFWPLSRLHSPKQFDRVFNGKSTFRLALERAFSVTEKRNVFVATNIRYRKQLLDQSPELPRNNFFLEPSMRDVGPAVGLVTAIFERLSPLDPMAIIWSDHLVKDKIGFARMLKRAEDFILADPDKIVFVGAQPRFPSENWGWIHLGRELKIDKRRNFRFYGFEGWHYRPSRELAQEYFESKKWVWNTGYFVATPAFLMDKFRLFQPEMAVKLEAIARSYGTPKFNSALKKIYPTLEKIHFDNAVVEKIDPEEAVVLTGEIGWSDVGTLYSLKEALAGSVEKNLLKGRVFDSGSTDSLLYNTDGGLLVTIGLSGMIVVQTPDATLVCPKEEVPTLKKVLKELEKTNLRKYL